MRNWLINLLFRLLGSSIKPTFEIDYLFGGKMNKIGRKKRWEKALGRLWRDKDMLDFLFYQAEADKEKIFKGKVDANLSKGARIRTLFFVHQAHRAYELQLAEKMKGAEERADSGKKVRELDANYGKAVDVK